MGYIDCSINSYSDHSKVEVKSQIRTLFDESWLLIDQCKVNPDERLICLLDEKIEEFTKIIGMGSV